MRRAPRFWAALVMLAGCQFDAAGAAGADDASAFTPDAATGVNSDASQILTPDATPCPAGYGFSSTTGTSYRFVTSNLLWAAAEQACESEGTHLVVITNPIERDVVVALAGTSSGGVDKVWMGLTDRKTENVWRFVTGATASEAQLYWNEGEPNGGADCTAFYRKNEAAPGEAGFYDDATCSLLNNVVGYVCECDGVPVDASAY